MKVLGQQSTMLMSTVKMQCFAVVFLSIILSVSVTAHEYIVVSSEASLSSCPVGMNTNSCNYLDHYFQDATAYFTSGVTFSFLAGNHSITQKGLVIVSDLQDISLIGPTSEEANIMCRDAFGLAMWNITRLQLRNIAFVNCGTETSPSLLHKTLERYGQTFFNITIPLKVAVFLNYITNLTISNATIRNSHGYGMLAVNILGTSVLDNLYFSENNYDTLTNNCLNTPSYECKGGNVVFLFTDLDTSPDIMDTYTLNVRSSVFEKGVDIGVIYQPFLITTVHQDGQFLTGAGIGIVMAQSSYGVDVTVDNCTLVNNIAYTGASLYILVYDFVDNSSIAIQNTKVLRGNEIPSGLNQPEGFYIIASLFYMYGLLPPSTYIPTRPAIGKFRCDTFTVENCTFAYNQAALVSASYLFLSAKTFTDFTRRITFRGNIYDSNNGDTILGIFNVGYAQNGLPFTFTLQNTSFINNHYIRQGSLVETIRPQAVLLHSVKFANVLNCTFLNNSITGIRALDSNIYLNEQNVFDSNTGYNGGALSLAEASAFYMKPNSVTIFRNNKAENFGGAIYGDMSSYKCFFQLPPMDSGETPRLIFFNNTAENAGDVIYGSLEDCFLENSTYIQDAMELFLQIATFDYIQSNESLVSASASRLCKCIDGKPNCSVDSTTISAFPGEEFSFTIAAVGYGAGLGEGLTPTVVQTSIDGSLEQAGVGTELAAQNKRQFVDRGCTTLNYSIFTPIPRSVKLILAPDTEKIFSPFVLNVTLNPCPPGFHLHPDPPYGCECDEFLVKQNITCDIDTQTIFRLTPKWIGMDNTQQLAVGECPRLGFCVLFNLPVELTNPDTQCRTGHSGALCGKCKQNLSLALGPPSCIQCSNTYLLLLVVFAAMGVLLLVFLSACNITIATGKISGLLFYTNIIRVTNFRFFGQTDSYIKPFSVFINWFNLEFGIASCFYNGLDIYAKSWLQYLFPAYLFILMGIAIVGARWSVRLANFIPKNIVPVFATVLLISFTKLLRSASNAIPYSYLMTSNRTYTVWSFDGNIVYWGQEHAPLAVFSLGVVLFLLLPYTVFLLIHPFLQKVNATHEGSRVDTCLLWVKARLFKLKPLFDAYEAPFKDNSRYWTGLLLTLRGIVFFTTYSSLGVDTGEAFNAAIVTLAAAVLLGMLAILKVYTSNTDRLIESFHLINLGILELVVLIVSLANATITTKNIIICVSIGVLFICFAATVLCQMIMIVQKVKLHNEVMACVHKWFTRSSDDVELDGYVIANDEPVLPQVTHSSVSIVEN